MRHDDQAKRGHGRIPDRGGKVAERECAKEVKKLKMSATGCYSARPRTISGHP